jgi:alpha-N-arabinofuranosidase
LHAPHIGATALPAEIMHGGSLPDRSSAVSATASRSAVGLAVTLINRHYSQEASVRLVCANAPGQARGQLLTADTPRAVNTAGAPDTVAPAALAVARDNQDGWRVELPPYSLATVVIHRA